MPQRLQVGVVGVGHLGSRHAEIYARMPRVTLAAVCDPNTARAKAVAARLGCAALTDVRQLAGRVEAASVAAPTSAHASIGRILLQRGIHVLMEKPLCTRLADADALIRTAARRRLTLMVGHVERFNAAIRTAVGQLRHPRFIEVHRLSPYPFRGTDVSVVLDVMIHDLDLLLAIVRSPVRRVQALGVPVLSRTEDIVNARLEFASGCVANVTASRISDEAIRRIRVFQEDRYVSIDSKAQTVELASLRSVGRRGRQAHRHGRQITRIQLPVTPGQPLQDELAAFVRAVLARCHPPISTTEARDALALALQIQRVIRRRHRSDQ